MIRLNEENMAIRIQKKIFLIYEESNFQHKLCHHSRILWSDNWCDVIAHCAMSLYNGRKVEYF